jgi:hypothetical protein
MPIKPPPNKLQRQFVLDCKAMTNLEVVEKWVYRGTPYALRHSTQAFVEWRSTLAECLGLVPDSIFVVGSTAAGLSLSPYKGLRMHSPHSDVDLGIVAPELFQIGWDWFIQQQAERIAFPQAVTDWIRDHRTRLIFYRQIGCEQYLEYLPFGRAWIDCLDSASRRVPVQGRSVKARIYASKSALTGYLVNSVGALRPAVGI